MRRWLGTLIIVLGLSVSFVSVAPAMASAMPNDFAVDVLNSVCQDNPDTQGAPSVCSDDQSGSNSNPLFGPQGVATIAVRILSLIVGIAAVVVIIIAGLRFIFASGNANSLSQARNAIIYALVGVVIAAISQAIVAFVLDKVK